MSDSEDDEPPPLPPPRIDSLKEQNGTSLNRPLPNIPKSVSDDDLNYENSDTFEKVNRYALCVSTFLEHDIFRHIFLVDLCQWFQQERKKRVKKMSLTHSLKAQYLTSQI